MPSEFAAHYELISRPLLEGRVVPLLGSGVNRCGRPVGAGWGAPDYLPDGAELASHLAGQAVFRDPNPADLVRVSQYYAVMLGLGPLYQALHDLFDADYRPTPVHTFLAGLPAARRRCDLPPRGDLIVTTNYDDALERAFRDAGEPFDLVAYQAVGKHAGSFVHYAPGDDDGVVIEVPNEYRALVPEQRTVILKLHGAVGRGNEERDSFVITEDDYIEYLTHTELGLLPVTLAAKLRRSHFLFLGYSLRDWNVRVILHRIWGEQRRLHYNSWAVQLQPAQVDKKFWEARAVDIYDVALEEYVQALSDRLDDCAQDDHA